MAFTSRIRWAGVRAPFSSTPSRQRSHARCSPSTSRWLSPIPRSRSRPNGDTSCTRRWTKAAATSSYSTAAGSAANRSADRYRVSSWGKLPTHAPPLELTGNAWGKNHAHRLPVDADLYCALGMRHGPADPPQLAQVRTDADLGKSRRGGIDPEHGPEDLDVRTRTPRVTIGAR